MAESLPSQPATHAERGDSNTGEQGRSAASTARTSGLDVRCPHCHQPMQLSDVDSVADLVCPACHGHFSLVGVDETLSRAWHVDKRLGDFRLIESVGVGAFGVVWKARDTRLDRTVAIKVPRSASLSAEETEKFVREARAAAQVQHPRMGRECDEMNGIGVEPQNRSIPEFTAVKCRPHEVGSVKIRAAGARPGVPSRL